MQLNGIHRLAACAAIMLISCTQHFVKTNQRTIDDSWAAQVVYARNHFPQSGTLQQKPDGYAYLKVDDRYIHELFERLKLPREFKKPPYFRRIDAPGAHISVAYENEHIRFSEIGTRFNFFLKDIVLIRANKKTSYVVLRVDAPDLESLRKKYGLFPKRNGYEFHITIAKKEHR